MYDGNDCNATEYLGTIVGSMDFYWFTQYSVILMRLLHVVADTACEDYKSGGWGSSQRRNSMFRVRYSHIEFEFPTARPYAIDLNMLRVCNIG